MKAKIKYLIIFLSVTVISLFLFSITQNSLKFSSMNIKTDGIGLNKAAETATIFVPGLVSTHRNEHDACLSPDLKEFYYTLTLPGAFILCMRNENGNWQEAENL